MDLRVEQTEALERAFTGRLPRQGSYLEIATSLFVQKIDLKMPELPAIAFYLNRGGKIEEIKKADQPFSPLALSTHGAILIHERDLPAIKRFAETQILSPSESTALPTEKRMETLRRSAMMVAEDLFSDPSPENIERSKKVVGSFVYVLMKDPRAFLYLSKLSSHDPYTLQHCVGTAVNSIILAKKVGYENEEDLNDIGLAGLLHDIGKVKVSKEIINKSGPLNEQEWQEMRKHPLYGYELVKDNPNISERVKNAVLQHHEDKNGQGYPQGLAWDQVDPFAKIIGLCDMYNALVTRRSYTTPRTPFEAFQFMRRTLYHKVDPTLFQSLVLIYGGEVAQDAQPEEMKKAA